MSLFDLLGGNSVLVTGVEEQPEGWVKVFVGPRWRNTYVVPLPEEVEKIKRAWEASFMGHLTMPRPDSDQTYNDQYPYEPSEGQQ